MSWGKERVWTTRRDDPLVTLDETGLRRLPIGSVREFTIGGVRVRASKHHPDRWMIHSGKVPVAALAGVESRRCVERVGGGK